MIRGTEGAIEVGSWQHWLSSRRNSSHWSAGKALVYVRYAKTHPKTEKMYPATHAWPGRYEDSSLGGDTRNHTTFYTSAPPQLEPAPAVQPKQ
jgi:hypothetical protein